MVKSFTVGVKHHVNLGNYESMEIEAQVSVDVEDRDFDARIINEAQKDLEILLASTFHAQKRPEWFAAIPAKRVRTA